MTTKEKRQDVRASVRIPVDIIVRDRFYNGWVKNMATGGVFVKTRGVFSVGEKISFYFLGENKSARVIRIESQGIAVRFG